MNTATITIEKAPSPNHFTRERRHAHGKDGGAVELCVSRHSSGKVTVYWNAHTGLGWFRGWRATRATEAEAMAFADEKWARLVAWLEKLVPKDEGRNGAVDAFSAQVASMVR
jgi:hypothetical protein